MFDLNDKTALVTGASRGIGKAIALGLAQAGATVIGTATTEAGAVQITDYLKKHGHTGSGKILDISNPQMIDAFFADISPPDILINNAGITRDNLFLRMKEDEWLQVINTNLNSIYYLTRHCIRPMLKKRWGRIISISSASAFMGNPGQSNYCAAKAGMIGFSKSLANEIASRHITVNVIAPGFIDTDMARHLDDAQRQVLLDRIACQRLGTPEEIAAAAVFLASPAASYITGETLQVNGGLYMQ